MCGIVGVISKNIIEMSILKKMTDAISHRGPDGEGHYIGEGFGFGHRRLSIVDLTDAGHQPMVCLDRYVITYNGEVYNYIELRKVLENAGYSFNSHTDTEVILAAYDYWGVECLNHFNGMWAFVIFDKQEKQFFISRDRFGIKPLYYYLNDELFIFGSEVKSIIEHPMVVLEPNIEYLKDYVKDGAKEYLKETAFKNIFRFNFASFFLGDVSDLLTKFKEIKFWDIKPNLRNEKFNKNIAKEYASQYYNLLEDAVRLRLRADVKVGSALSGGLDSSSIVYLVNKILKEQGKQELQETFSSVYKSERVNHCDESEYIDTMANYLKVNSNQIEPAEKDVLEEHKKMIYMLENPPESTLMSSWHTFKLVSSTSVKVTLDGQGADEQLAGYLPYIMHYIASLGFYDMLKEAYYSIKIPGSKKYVIRGIVIGLCKNIFGIKVTKIFINKILRKNVYFDLNQLLVQDTTKNNLITLIHFADHTSMAFSIESRMPFMDYRLVEFTASIPVCYKIHKGWTKYIARLAFDSKLPDEVCWRKDKLGWPVPEEIWFNGNLKYCFRETILKCDFLKSVNLFMNHKNTFDEDECLTKKIRYLNIAVWYDIFFKKRKQI